MRKVLVTGGRGFIGGYVCEALEARNILPVSFDRVWHEGRGVQAQHLGDVRDHHAVSESVSQVDGVVHLAGVLGTQETIIYPGPAVETNIHGSLNVFDACTLHKKPCVYIAVGNHWMDNSYSITKTTAERFARMYRQERGADIRIVRALNAYGPRQKLGPVRKILPTFISQALAGKPIEIYGNGEQIMDMIHVRDVAEVLVRALLTPNPAPLYEAGTGRRTTVQEIALMVLAATGQPWNLKFLPMRPGEPPAAVVLANPDTLAPLFSGPEGFGDWGWTRLEEGIAETVEYYRGAR